MTHSLAQREYMDLDSRRTYYKPAIGRKRKEKKFTISK